MPGAAKQIDGLPWVKDGVSGENEMLAVINLLRLFEVGWGDSIIGEPWVVAGSNFPALAELRLLSWNTRPFERFIVHPAIVDGITEQEAKVLATLETIAYPDRWGIEDPDLLDKLLDPDQRILEERTVPLPLAGETEIILVRTVAGDSRTMDFVERTMQSIEEFMGLPFPQQPVTIVLVDSFGGGFAFGTHIQVNRNREPGFGQELQGRSSGGWFRFLAHELSHYYWRGPPQWLVEGAATFMELAVSDELHLTPEDAESLLIERKFGPCTRVENLSELEALRGSSDTYTDAEWFELYDCVYLRGAMLWYDLYHALGDVTFRQAFRRVYLHKRWIAYGHSPSAGECGEESAMSICHVKEAFRTYVPDEEWPAVQAIIDRRYGPTAPE